jgi:hypothetical protein
MSQHDYVVSNGSGAAVREDINSLAGAIASLNSGTTAPTTTFAHMLWADETTGILKQRNAANSAWISLLTMATGALVSADQVLSALAASSDFYWMTRAVGEIIYLPTHLTGIVEPPTDSSLYRYAKLTAGLTGGGGYNNGILTSESTSGSAPTNTATAVVSLSGSPIDGQTIRLLNTEGRRVRPGTSAGTLQNDQMQQITGSFDLRLADDSPPASVNLSASGAFSRTSGTDANTLTTQPAAPAAARTIINFDSSTSTDARTGTETHEKNIQHTAYMRIK